MTCPHSLIFSPCMILCFDTDVDSASSWLFSQMVAFIVHIWLLPELLLPCIVMLHISSVVSQGVNLENVFDEMKKFDLVLCNLEAAKNDYVSKHNINIYNVWDTDEHRLVFLYGKLLSLHSTIEAVIHNTSSLLLNNSQKSISYMWQNTNIPPFSLEISHLRETSCRVHCFQLFLCYSRKTQKKLNYYHFTVKLLIATCLIPIYLFKCIFLELVYKKHMF